MRTDELDFSLPPELIAQAPPIRRGESRLLHYRKRGGAIAHRMFSDLPRLLRPGDLLVFNNAKVIPARFMLRKQTGGAIEGLFISQAAPGRWRVMLRGLESHRGPLQFDRAPEVSATVVLDLSQGEYEINVAGGEDAVAFLERVGRMPLPPYIKRDKQADRRDDEDRERYQTVYADAPGSVAAPTAGLHFSPEIFASLDAAGIARTFVTLHVGLGTFKPVTAPTLDEHRMHTERFEITPDAADALNRAKADRRRIIAIGTTSARVLEAHPALEPWKASAGETSIFIKPGFAWNHVGALLTNFHLPRSTLIALVAALVGLDEQRTVYRTAIEEKYRFFSYGDAMFVEE